jgi:hypothetical protein
MSSACLPDETVDLNRTPWPWKDNQFAEIAAHHILEHLGSTSDEWIAVLKELWRISRSGARIYVSVPHPRHDDFISDCTHVRPILPTSFLLFDQVRNQLAITTRDPEPPLGIIHGVDFKIESVDYVLEEPWASARRAGTLSEDRLHSDLKHLSNVSKEIRIVLETVKPGRSEKAALS